MDDVAIESGVPVPPPKPANIFLMMGVGDSVWIDEPNTGGPAYRKAINTRREKGWKFRGVQENGGIRIWRVK